MRYLILNLLAFIAPMVCIAQEPTSQESAKKVAIYITGDINPAYKKVIGAKMVSTITSSNQFVAVERTADFLATLSKEQDYQVSGVVSNDQIAKLGEQFGVQYVITADASTVFESIFVSARMINVESAQIIASTECESKVNSMESLMQLAIDISESFTGGLLLENIRIIGPINSTNESDDRGLDIDHWREQVRLTFNEIKSTAKALKQKGQNVYPVCVDIKTSKNQISSNGEWRDYRESFTITLLNSDDSTTQTSAYKTYSSRRISSEITGIKNKINGTFPQQFYIIRKQIQPRK